MLSFLCEPGKSRVAVLMFRDDLTFYVHQNEGSAGYYFMQADGGAQHSLTQGGFLEDFFCYWQLLQSAFF